MPRQDEEGKRKPEAPEHDTNNCRNDRPADPHAMIAAALGQYGIVTQQAQSEAVLWRLSRRHAIEDGERLARDDRIEEEGDPSEEFAHPRVH